MGDLGRTLQGVEPHLDRGDGVGYLDITRQGAGHLVALHLGSSMVLQGTTLRVKRPFRSANVNELASCRCAGLTCRISVSRSRSGEQGYASWELRLWRDSKSSVELCGGPGPEMDPLRFQSALELTDSALAASPLGKVAVLLDDAIVGAPRDQPLPGLEVGSYFTGDACIVWIPSLGFALLDHGSRPPDGTMAGSSTV